MERRRRVGVINRRLGWVILPMVLMTTAIHFGPGRPEPDTARYLFVLLMQFVYGPLVMVHLAMSVYVFGWVRPSRSLRVFHIWFGYAYAALILGANATWSFPTLHGILTGAMFVALGAHVAIGVHYARRRRVPGIGLAARSRARVLDGAA
jgi:hypothetical protein